jgi:phosphoenolpyruvate carboxykinase (ATP)
MIHAILRGELDEAPSSLDPSFGVRVPQQIRGLEGFALSALEAWGGDEAAYQTQARVLSARFQENFLQYGEEVAQLATHGPITQ